MSVDDSETDASVDVVNKSNLSYSESEDVVDDANSCHTDRRVWCDSRLSGQVVKQLPSIAVVTNRITLKQIRSGNEGKSPDRRLWLTCTTPS
jgi:hypothetical protein